MRRTSTISLSLAALALSTLAAADCKPGRPDGAGTAVAIDPAARERQTKAIRAMKLENLEYSARGPVTVAKGDTGIVLPADVTFRTEGAPADDLLPLLADVLLANGSESFRIKENRENYPGERGLVLEQSIRGIPVMDGVVSLGFNPSTRRVTTIAAHFIPDRGLPKDPKLSKRQAQESLQRALAIAEKVNADDVRVEKKGVHLGYFAGYDDPVPPQLVWVFEAALNGWDRELFVVDAETGIVAFRRALGSDGPTRPDHSAEVVGVQCDCTGGPKPAATRIGPDCGRRMEMSWKPTGAGDRYIGWMARPDLGWVFGTLAIDTHSTACVCEFRQSTNFRIQSCNGCGCGPWSDAGLIEVEKSCPTLGP